MELLRTIRWASSPGATELTADPWFRTLPGCGTSRMESLRPAPAIAGPFEYYSNKSCSQVISGDNHYSPGIVTPSAARSGVVRKRKE